jgi:hypothetical protein
MTDTHGLARNMISTDEHASRWSSIRLADADEDTGYSGIALIALALAIGAKLPGGAGCSR